METQRGGRNQNNNSNNRSRQGQGGHNGGRSQQNGPNRRNGNKSRSESRVPDGPAIPLTKLQQQRPDPNGAVPHNFQFQPRPFRKVSPSKSKYLQSPTGHFVTHIVESVDPWDAENQLKAAAVESRMASEDTQAVYDQLQELREKERAQMESRGLVDSVNTRKNLSDALSFVGTCREMCPVFERVRRSLENNVMSFERGPNGKISRDLAIKAFSRPAAGQAPPLPSDVRPPSVLVNTLNYLLKTMVPQMPQSHPFLWDRTRSIRQDFTYQNYAGPEAIHCSEMVARLHIYSLHIMAGSGMDYSPQQELEQLNKTLQSLSEFYSLNPKRKAGDFPMEPEIRAYQLLSHLRDTETDMSIDTLPEFVVNSPLVKLAKELRALVYRLDRSNSFGVFFHRVRQPDVPVLFQCLLEASFSEFRRSALLALGSALNARAPWYPIERLAKALAFDSPEAALEFATYFGIPSKIGEDQRPVVDLKHPIDLEKRLPPQPHSAFITSRLEPSVITAGLEAAPSFNGSPATSARGFAPPKALTFQAQSKPSSFSFTNPSTNVGANGNASGASKPPSTATPPPFRFGGASKGVSKSLPTGPSDAIAPQPGFGLNLGTPSQASPGGITPTQTIPQPKLPEAPKPPRAPKYNDADYRAVIDRAIAKTVKGLIEPGVRSQIQRETESRATKRRAVQRQAFIDTSSEEIMQRLLAKTVGNDLRNILQAHQFRNWWTKTRAWKRISKVLRRIAREAKYKREIDAIVQGSQRPNTNLKFAKRRKISDNVGPSASRDVTMRDTSDSSVQFTEPSYPSDADRKMALDSIFTAWSRGAQDLALVLKDWDSEIGRFLVSLFDLQITADGPFNSVALESSRGYFYIMGVPSSTMTADITAVFETGEPIDAGNYAEQFSLDVDKSGIARSLCNFIAAVPRPEFVEPASIFGRASAAPLFPPRKYLRPAPPARVQESEADVSRRLKPTIRRLNEIRRKSINENLRARAARARSASGSETSVSSVSDYTTASTPTNANAPNTALRDLLSSIESSKQVLERSQYLLDSLRQDSASTSGSNGLSGPENTNTLRTKIVPSAGAGASATARH